MIENDLFPIGTKFRIYLLNGFYYDNLIVDYTEHAFFGKLYIARHLEHGHLNLFTHETILNSVILGLDSNKDLHIEKILKNDCTRNEYVQLQLF